MLTRQQRRVIGLFGLLIWSAILVLIIVMDDFGKMPTILLYVAGSLIIIVSFMGLNWNYMLYSYVFSKSLQRDTRRGIFFVSYRKNQVRFLKSGFNHGGKMSIQEFGNTYLGLHNPLGGEVAAALGELDTDLYKKPLVKVKTVVGVKYYSIYCLKRLYKGVICMIIDETISSD